MKMHMVFANTAKQKMYQKTFVIQHVISHLDTYLRTNNFMYSIINFEAHETFQ